MRKSLVFTSVLIVSLVLGLDWKTHARANPEQRTANHANAITPQVIIQEMIDQVSQERLLADLRRFTGEEPMCLSSGSCSTILGRETGTQDLQWVKNYVYETLLDLNYSVEVLNWYYDEGHHDQNILAHKRGLLYPNQEIYFIAHLDGTLINNPAADDDGSGSVALLELARILAHRTLSYSVTLFFSTGEEHGSLGSHEFVAHFHDRLANIKYLVSVEMVSYDSNNDGWMELWSGDANIEFQQTLSEVISAYPIDLVPQILPGCT